MEHDSDLTKHSVLRLTLDTNLLLEYWKKQDRASTIEKLLSLATTGSVDLAVTARIREDIPLSPLANRLNELGTLNVSEAPSMTRHNFWVWDRDVWGDEEFIAFSSTIDGKLQARGARVPDWRDWDHVHAHYVLKRDIFLTWDRPLLSIRNDLQDRFGIVIMTPETYLANRA